MKKSLATIALLGAASVAGVAQAATATLTGVTQKNGANIATVWQLGNETWDLNTSTGVATQTSGTWSGYTSVAGAVLSTLSMTDGVLSSGAAAATSWSCAEGTFGTTVSKFSKFHICGNYSFGADLKNNSTYNPTATGATVTLGGDDMVLGAPQTLANQFSAMTLTNLGGGNWLLSNTANDTVNGYNFSFNVVPVPAAVWLFGSALGLMGLARRRAAV
jgi:hypothetical protein